MLMAYASVAAFFLVAVGFIVGSLLAGKLLRPDNMYPEKLETYECGEAPVGPAWFNFNPRFYIIALIYIVFDVEIAFVYPVATVFKRWVEQGTPPEQFIGTKFTDAEATTRTVKFTRPICVYPGVPRYKGTGDPNDAASFVCTK